MIEEEKENTEQPAEETESREGRGSLGSLRRFKSVSSLDLHPVSSGACSCPPLPKPRRRRHLPAREGDRLGIMTRLQEQAMATHSSTLAWKIPWTEEPGWLQSMGSHRVGHD